MKCNLVEVAKAHPLYGRRLPLGQRGDKLHGRRLLLQDAERQRAQHGVALVDEGLGGGASVDRDHLTACGTEIFSVCYTDANARRLRNSQEELGKLGCTHRRPCIGPAAPPCSA